MKATDSSGQYPQDGRCYARYRRRLHFRVFRDLIIELRKGFANYHLIAITAKMIKTGFAVMKICVCSSGSKA